MCVVIFSPGQIDDNLFFSLDVTLVLDTVEGNNRSKISILSESCMNS